MTLFEGVIFASLAVMFAALFSPLWKESRAPYLLGIGAAAVAFALVIWLRFVLYLAAPLGFLLISPAVEEMARLTFVLLTLRLSANLWAPTSIAFGVGFGSLELITELADPTLYQLQVSLSALSVAAILMVPVISFALHVFLSVAAFFFRTKRSSVAATYLALVGLHVLHNASIVLFAAPTSAVDVILNGSVRLILFAAAIFFMVRNLPTAR